MSFFIGLLSGTSVDGIDAAIVDFNQDEIKLMCTHEQKFTAELQKDLQAVIKSQKASLDQLSQIDSRIANEFSEAVNNLINQSKIPKKDITAIGFHGQTIFHQPNGEYKNTLQLGSAHQLAAKTGLDVVTNFRSLDMAYGGQGAPLAPVIHQKLFAKKNTNTAVINLGGIANISLIGKDYISPIGYDTGPANCLIDEWVNVNKQQDYDKNGYWAKQGKLNKKLLDMMLDDNYFKKRSPKSTGREYFNKRWYDTFLCQFNGVSVVDVQATLTHLTAASIADAIQNEKFQVEEIVVMGGGAKNLFLLDLISQYTGVTTVISNKYGYNSDWIEAILFAFLAKTRINHEAIDLSLITGSTEKLFVGDIINIS